MITHDFHMLRSDRSRSCPLTRVLCRLILTLFAAGVFSIGGSALGQYEPPEGNAHPKETLDASKITNPLNDPLHPSASGATIQQKYDFSRQVDLSPLAGLAVMHNSRVAVLDTAARDDLTTITGKGEYCDVILTSANADGSLINITRRWYPPLFTYIDMMADLHYYLDKPLLMADYLPLRQSILENEFPKVPDNEQATLTNKQALGYWMMTTHLSPQILSDQNSFIQNKLLADSQFSRPLGELGRGWSTLNNLDASLQIIAPEVPHGDWTNAALNPKVAALFHQLGDAWRAMDAPKVNSIAREIGTLVPSVNATNYPPAWRSQLELFYNGEYKFIVGYSLYFLAAVTLLIAFGTGRVTIRRIGLAFLLAALTIHAGEFTMRWILAQRIPIQNQFESMLGLCLGACIFGTAAMFIRKQPIFGVAAAAVGFLTLMAATTTGIPGESIGREAAILNTSYILFYHVNTVLFSYGLISLGFIVSSVYLATYFLSQRSPAAIQVAAAGVGVMTVSTDDFADDGAGMTGTSSAGKSSKSGSAAGRILPGRQRLLNDLDHAQMVILQLAFWILGVGILLGAYWANFSWGRWWAFDPKEVWALITWICYLIIVHVRFGVKNRGLVTAFLSIIGFLVMLWTYFGVNLLLPGLHAYA